MNTIEGQGKSSHQVCGKLGKMDRSTWRTVPVCYISLLQTESDLFIFSRGLFNEVQY